MSNHNDKSERICGICLETEPCIFNSQGCGHSFHWCCLAKWFCKSNSTICPSCRQPHPNEKMILVNLWCLDSFIILSYIKCCLLDSEYGRNRVKAVDFMYWKRESEESFDQSLNRILPDNSEAIEYILNFACQHTRLTRLRHSLILDTIKRTKNALAKFDNLRNPIAAKEFRDACVSLYDCGTEYNFWRCERNFEEFKIFVRPFKM